MSRSILIVDDNAELRNLLASAFASAGFSVSQAGDGAEGLRTGLAERPDLVVTDLAMPVRDGPGLIAGLRTRDPDAKIIAISGGGAPLGCHLTAARALGALEIFRKPFLPGEIRSRPGACWRAARRPISR